MAKKLHKNKCTQCGRETNCPKFCSRSCAAKYNNTKSPKRKPEGNCSRCGVAIPSRKQYCSECKSLVEQEQLKQEQGIRNIRLPSGTIIERKIPLIESSLVLKFNLQRFTIEDLCGAFLDAVIGVCLSDIDCIRVDNKKRYISLLEDFRNFKFENFKRKGMVGDLPLEIIGLAIDQWIEGYCDQETCHPLMSSYALDAADFMHRLLEGVGIQISDNRYIRVEPLAEDYYEIRRSDIYNAQFKRKMSMDQVGGLLVTGIIPEEYKILSYDEKIVLNAGQRFGFAITKCHLSIEHYDSWIEQHTSMTIKGPDEHVTFIEDDMHFDGHLVLNPGQSDYVWSHEPNCKIDFHILSRRSANCAPTRILLPCRWFTHAYKRSQEANTIIPLPVPVWD